MNPFLVNWPPPILRELANIWINATNRRAVTAAQAQIDQLLKYNPLNPVAHKSEGLFRLFVAPLVVTYEVNENARTVEITSIRYVR